MQKQKYFQVLQAYLIGGSLFIILDGVFHLVGIRLNGTYNMASIEMLFVLRFFMMLWGSAAVITGTLLYLLVQQNYYTNPIIVKFLGCFAFLHGLLLWHLSFFNWNTMPQAMHLWHPYYSQQLQIEGSLCMLFGLYVAYGIYKKLM